MNLKFGSNQVVFTIQDLKTFNNIQFFLYFLDQFIFYLNRFGFELFFLQLSNLVAKNSPLKINKWRIHNLNPRP